MPYPLRVLEAEFDGCIRLPDRLVRMLIDQLEEWRLYESYTDRRHIRSRRKNSWSTTNAKGLHSRKRFQREELTEPWTAVHGTDDDSEILETVTGHEHRVYEDAAGRAVVESYLLANMAHTVPVDPGPGPDQCGSTSQHTAAVGICSSYYAARFWGLISE